MHPIFRFDQAYTTLFYSAHEIPLISLLRYLATTTTCTMYNIYCLIAELLIDTQSYALSVHSQTTQNSFHTFKNVLYIDKQECRNFTIPPDALSHHQFQQCCRITSTTPPNCLTLIEGGYTLNQCFERNVIVHTMSNDNDYSHTTGFAREDS